MNPATRETARVSPIHQAVIDALVESDYPARYAAASPAGCALAQSLPDLGARDYLASFCATEPGAHRVLGLSLALGRTAAPDALAAAYSVAAWAALALDRKTFAQILLRRATAADPRYSLALLLFEGLYLSDLPAVAYREASAATRLRLTCP
jgi:Domain of unknown function (DUF4192)